MIWDGLPMEQSLICRHYAHMNEDRYYLARCVYEIPHSVWKLLGLDISRGSPSLSGVEQWVRGMEDACWILLSNQAIQGDWRGQTQRPCPVAKVVGTIYEP